MLAGFNHSPESTPEGSGSSREVSELKFSTPASTQVYNNPLAVTIEEKEFEMPALPEPPVFHGDAEKDTEMHSSMI